MRTLTFLLDDELDGWLRTEAQRRGVSVRTVLADLVREAARSAAAAPATATSPIPSQIPTPLAIPGEAAPPVEPALQAAQRAEAVHAEAAPAEHADADLQPASEPAPPVEPQPPVEPAKPTPFEIWSRAEPESMTATTTASSEETPVDEPVFAAVAEPADPAPEPEPTVAGFASLPAQEIEATPVASAWRGDDPTAPEASAANLDDPAAPEASAATLMETAEVAAPPAPPVATPQAAGAVPTSDPMAAVEVEAALEVGVGAAAAVAVEVEAGVEVEPEAGIEAGDGDEADDEGDAEEEDGEDEADGQAGEAPATTGETPAQPRRRRRRRRGGRGRRAAAAAAAADAPSEPNVDEAAPTTGSDATPAAPWSAEAATNEAAASTATSAAAETSTAEVTVAEVAAPAPIAAAAPPRPQPAEPPAHVPSREEIEDELVRFDIHAIPQHPVETTALGFAELGLSPPIVSRLEEIGFHHPTPIQAAVIPHALAGRDVVGLAETGSGKTAAFVLPLAERLQHGRGIRGLIIAPTRELALQTHAFIDILGRDRNLEAVSLVGGLAIAPQADRLKRRPDFIVATPGRLVDHLERGNVRLDLIEHLVLDEADHMLDLGFLPQVMRILETVPPARQTLLFSATMPPPIARIATQFQRDPVRIDITPEGKAAAGISHRLYLVRPDDKKACLLALLHQELGSTLVFIRRRSDAEWLTGVLEREGHPVARIHSDLTQAQRLKALTGFREGEHRILVATDVASRGLDVPAISHVINFDPPDSVEDYVHRAGRTARGSALGIVSTIASFLEKPMIAEIEHTLGEAIPRCTVPGVEPYVESKQRPTIRRRRLSF